MLKHDYLLANIRVDTAENEPTEVGTTVSKVSRMGHSPAVQPAVLQAAK